MSKPLRYGMRGGRAYPLSLLDRVFHAAARQNAALLLAAVFSMVAVIGYFLMRDIQTAYGQAHTIYSQSVNGLQRIGELQYDAQETRRSTLYALSTTDSNLQVQYADQSRAADQKVKDGIAEYASQAHQAAEIDLAGRLARDWTAYLKVRDEVLASILEGSIRDAVTLDLSGGIPAFERVRQDLDEVKRLYDQEAAQEVAMINRSWHRSSWRLTGMLALTFCLSAAAIWIIQRARMLSTIQLAKLQMDFVASVSHELRTPLSIIRSASDNIADGVVSERSTIQKYGALLRNQSRRMSELVDEIMLFASTEDGKQRYVSEPLDLEPAIESVVLNTERLIQGTDASFVWHMQPNLPRVMADALGLSQCLENLLGNAIKYGGESPKVTLTVVSAPAQDGPGEEVQITVADNGIGIESSELERIFEPFYRSPRVSAAQIQGTGLGLALTSRIAEAMEARITVTSELGAGSTFTLHLQTEKGEELQRFRGTSGSAATERL